MGLLLFALRLESFKANAHYLMSPMQTGPNRAYGLTHELSDFVVGNALNIG
jgi:hypothetical protein